MLMLNTNCMPDTMVAVNTIIFPALQGSFNLVRKINIT